MVRGSKQWHIGKSYEADKRGGQWNMAVGRL